jgi:DNA-binding transcriptional ArsR family regulator
VRNIAAHHAERNRCALALAASRPRLDAPRAVCNLDNVSVTYLSIMPRPSASADPFLAVADPTRRAILDRLRAGDAPVAQLAEGFAMTRPAISRHLRVLREARLVRERRGGDDGRQRIYQLTAAPLREVARWAESYETFWQESLARLKRHVEQSSGSGRGGTHA